jgi:MerR family transcriptional regulator, Zn(II)-responsive regulator of zntA
MITVKRLAERADVTADAVRHYVRIGLLTPERDPRNGYKRFTDADARRLRFIRQAKSLGYTLAEIAEIFEHSERGRSPCPRVRELIGRRITDNRKLVDDLGALQDRMERALERWKTMPDGVPDGDSICHLIESEPGTERERGSGCSARRAE